MMAQDFSLQGVLGSEERSGLYGRASLCALEGKRQARACPAQSVWLAPLRKTDNLLKINSLSNFGCDLVRNAG